MQNRVWFAHPVVTLLRRGQPATTRITLAFTEAADGSVLASAAFCSPADNFRRRTGRNISQGRLRSGLTVNLGRVGNLHGGELTARAVKLLRDSGGFPRTWSEVAPLVTRTMTIAAAGQNVVDYSAM